MLNGCETNELAASNNSLHSGIKVDYIDTENTSSATIQKDIIPTDNPT